MTYELDLPNSLKVHPVISVIHFEQYREDPFRREPPEVRNPDSIVVDEQDQYVVEKIVRTETRGGDLGYVVKWKGYEKTTWEPEAQLMKDIPEHDPPFPGSTTKTSTALFQSHFQTTTQPGPSRPEGKGQEEHGTPPQPMP